MRPHLYRAKAKAHGYNETYPQYSMDEYRHFTPRRGALSSAAGGKSFQPLADYFHGKVLRFGTHIMWGVPVVGVKRGLPAKDGKGHLYRRRAVPLAQG